MSQTYPNSLPYGQGGAKVPSALMQKGINFANQLDQDTLIKLIKSATAPIVIAPKVGITITVDAYALGQLVKITKKKDTSFFNVILQNITGNNGKDFPNFGLPLGYGFSLADIPELDIWDADSGERYHLSLPYTSTQYEGLAAVQEAGETQYPGEGMKQNLPDLSIYNPILVDTNIGFVITDLGGHKISATATGGKLATVAILEETDPEGIKVPFEEIQKLIGLPIEVNEDPQG